MLNKKQADTLDAIARLTAEKGYPPSFRELMLALGLKSPAPVQARLASLKKVGRVDWVPGGNRTLRVLPEPQPWPTES